MSWTTPSTWVAGAVLTAAQLNQQLRDNMDAIGGAWPAYTPTWTNLTIGNATQDSAYVNAGKLYIVRISLTFGTTTSISGIPEATLPNGVSMDAAYHGTAIMGAGGFGDATGNDYQAIVMRSGSTAARVRLLTVGTGAAYAYADAVSSTIPFTWTTSDKIGVTFVFESA